MRIANACAFHYMCCAQRCGFPRAHFHSILGLFHVLGRPEHHGIQKGVEADQRALVMTADPLGSVAQRSTGLCQETCKHRALTLPLGCVSGERDRGPTGMAGEGREGWRVPFRPLPRDGAARRCAWRDTVRRWVRRGVRRGLFEQGVGVPVSLPGVWVVRLGVGGGGMCGRLACGCAGGCTCVVRGRATGPVADRRPRSRGENIAAGTPCSRCFG